MANKKINEIGSRTPSLTDLTIVGDPSTGYSYYCTISQLQGLFFSTVVNSVFGRQGDIVATDGDYTLTQLGDVTITTPATNQVLTYNGTTWVNQAISFTNIYTSNGTLTGNRVVTVGTNSLTFQGPSSSNALVISTAGRVLVNTATDVGYQLDVSGTFRNTGNAFIATSGNLAIGTTSPQSNAKVSVFGTVTASVGVLFGYGMLLGPTINAANNNDTLIGLDIAPIFNNGSFAGVTNYSIRTNGSILFTSGNRYIYHNDTNSILVGRDSSGVYFANGFGSQTIDIGTSSTGNIRLRTSGNVGIGVTSPLYKLDVAGDINASGGVYCNGFSNTGQGTMISYATNFANGEFSTYIYREYKPTTLRNNLNSYGLLTSITWDLTSASYTNGVGYNTAVTFSQAEITGNTTTKATAKFSGYSSSLVAGKASTAANISEFSFYTTRAESGISVNNTIDNMYGLFITQMKGRTYFTVTNGWGIYQEGSSDNNYFNGKVLIGTSTPGGSPVRISGLPTSATGLSTGDLWNDSGTIKIA